MRKKGDCEILPQGDDSEMVEVEFEVEYQPVNYDREKKKHIKFYDDSEEFSDALSKLSGLIKKKFRIQL